MSHGRHAQSIPSILQPAVAVGGRSRLAATCRVDLRARSEHTGAAAVLGEHIRGPAAGAGGGRWLRVAVVVGVGLAASCSRITSAADSNGSVWRAQDALAVVGGIGGLVALVVAYRKQRFAEREHVRAEVAVGP